MAEEAVSYEELEGLRDSVRGFLARRSDSAEVRKLMDTDEGFDEKVWLEAANQLGLQALTIPEEFGGAGFSVIEQGVALEEIGRSLYVAPFMSSSVAATNVVLYSDDDAAKEEFLPELASGEFRATLAIGERSWEQGVEHPSATAIVAGEGWRLTGDKTLVLDGSTATAFIATAATPNGTSLFIVEATADGVETTALPVIDLTRKLSNVSFTASPARLLGAEGAADEILARAMDLTVAALAAEQVGAADRALEITIEYLKVREAFGRVLASFQALKHRCADMVVQVETARALTNSAIAAGAREDWEELSRLSAMAKARSWDVLEFVASEAVQLHGGVGFTWAFDPHLYFKRAKGNQFLFGDLTTYRETAAAQIGL